MAKHDNTGRDKVFLQTCNFFGVQPPTPEYKFHDTRKWRFDFSWPAYKVALEVEGGVYTQGRHTRASGYLGDVEKYNEAAILGWKVLRCTPNTLLKLATFNLIKRAINQTK